MTKEEQKKTVLIGLGNNILSDDGVGWYAAKEVFDELPEEIRAGIDLKLLALGGLALMDELTGYQRAIIVDAFFGEGEVGEIKRLTIEEIRSKRPQGWVSMHEISLPEAVEFTKKMGYDLPEEIVIFAVVVKDPFTFGEELTPEVKAALPKVKQTLRTEILSK